MESGGPPIRRPASCWSPPMPAACRTHPSTPPMPWPGGLSVSRAGPMHSGGHSAAAPGGFRKYSPWH